MCSFCVSWVLLAFRGMARRENRWWLRQFHVPLGTEHFSQHDAAPYLVVENDGCRMLDMFSLVVIKSSRETNPTLDFNILENERRRQEAIRNIFVRLLPSSVLKLRLCLSMIVQCQQDVQRANAVAARQN